MSSSRSPISLLTGSFHWNERPKSPCSRFHSHLRYWRVQRQVEAVLVLQGADHLLVHRHAARLQVVDHGAQVVAGRELDDDERHHRYRQHGDRHQQDAA